LRATKFFGIAGRQGNIAAKNRVPRSSAGGGGIVETRIDRPLKNVICTDRALAITTPST